MSIADRSPGLAENNSFTVFEHAPEYYPLSMGFNEIEKACLWDVISSVSHCVLNHIEDEPVETAVRWITSLDRLFGEDTVSAETYWAYHAASLLVGRDHDTWRDRAELLKPRVAKLLSVPTRRRLDEIWSRVLVRGESTFDIAAIRKLIEKDSPPDRQLHLLREISHSAIGQIGLNGKQEIPLVLYAWYRHFTA